MRGLAIVVACAACGRIDVDALGDVGFFISPTGSDANPGTRAAPWQSFAYAIPQLAPGGRLTLLDGDYDASGPSGALVIDCTAGAIDGTTAAPIVMRADHPRRAHVTTSGSAVMVSNCTSWEIDDLWLEGSDVVLGFDTPLVRVAADTGITLSGLLIVHPNRDDNNHALEIDDSTQVLVEDSEAYDFFRIAFTSYASSSVTFRRLYANGAGAQDIAGGYVSVCPGGDNGIQTYYSFAAVIEDCIVEDTCSNGFSVSTGRQASGDTGLGDGSTFAADIALGTGDAGFEVFTDCDATDPCSSPDRIASNNSFANSAAFGATIGFRLEGIANAVDHVTAMATDDDVEMQMYDPAGGYAATAFATALLGNGGAAGVASFDQSDWGVASSNVFGAEIPYVPDDAHVTGSTMLDPQLGGCLVYVPTASPMRAAGPNGTPIGADIRTQTVAGAATTTPYWRSDGTFAGCGAVVPGVNDDPATSCIGVHQRLNVGSGGCALP